MFGRKDKDPQGVTAYDVECDRLASLDRPSLAADVFSRCFSTDAHGQGLGVRIDSELLIATHYKDLGSDLFEPNERLKLLVHEALHVLGLAGLLMVMPHGKGPRYVPTREGIESLADGRTADRIRSRIAWA